MWIDMVAGIAAGVMVALAIVFLFGEHFTTQLEQAADIPVEQGICIARFEDGECFVSLSEETGRLQ